MRATNSTLLKTSSIRYYDKKIKQCSLFTKEEEISIFTLMFNIKKNICNILLNDINIFNKFKKIASEYLDNDNLMDFILFDTDFCKTSDLEEIVDFYETATNSIILLEKYEDTKDYTNLIYFSNEAFNSLICLLSNEEREKYNIDNLLKIIDSIRDRIIEHNLAMAVELALKYKNTIQISLDDAIQGAMIGLSIAVDKFNPFIKTKLSTSAYSWIFQGIQRLNDNTCELIQTPCNIIEQSKKNNKIINDLLKSKGSFPSADEICEAAGNDSYLVSVKRYDSFDSVDANNIQLCDKIKDPNIADNTTILEYNKLKNKMKDIINSLDDKEKEIIELMFGYNNKEPLSNKAIMDKLSIDNYSFNKLRTIALNKVKDLVEEEFEFDNWREIFESEEL